MNAFTTFESIWKAARGDEAQTAFKSRFMIGGTIATYVGWLLLTCLVCLFWGSEFGDLVHITQITTFFQDAFVRQIETAVAIVSGLIILSLNLKLIWNALYALLLLPVACFFAWVLFMVGVLWLTAVQALLVAIIFALILGVIHLPMSKPSSIALYYLTLALLYVANGIVWCKNLLI